MPAGERFDIISHIPPSNRSAFSTGYGCGYNDAFTNLEGVDFLLIFLRPYLPSKYHFLLTRWPVRSAVEEILYRFVPVHVGERKGFRN